MYAIVDDETVEMNGRRVSVGIIKTQRTKKETDERSGKNKTRRLSDRDRDLPAPNPQVEDNQTQAASTPAVAPALTQAQTTAPAVVSPAVSAENPPVVEKKIEKSEVKMDTIVAPATAKKIPTPVSGFVMCLCGHYSRHVVINGEPFWICIGCDTKYRAYRESCEKEYKIYAEQTVIEIKAGKNPVILPLVIQFKPEWILSQTDIASIERKLADARLTMVMHNQRYQRHNQLRQQRGKQIVEKIQDKIGGKVVHHEILKALRSQYEKEFAEEDKKLAEEDAENAKNDIILVRYLNAWLTEVKSLKAKMEKKIAERTVNATTTAPETTTPGPTNTAVLVVPEPVSS